MIDYSVYRLSSAQRMAAILMGCSLTFFLVWVMYRHKGIALALAPVGLLYPRHYASYLCHKRRDRLRLHFKEALHALSSLLSAGRSIENAFAVLEKDLMLLIGDTHSDLLLELRVIINRLYNGEPLELCLQDFAKRSNLDEVRNFADVISICKKAGGDMIEVVRRTTQLIGEKLDVELEVAVLIAQKKFEARIMIGMPFVFVGVLELMATDYMSPLHEGMGVAVLTLCLLFLGLCSYWMLRIMDIKL